MDVKTVGSQTDPDAATPSPMRIEIRVVKHEGELLFETGGRMFDLLEAHYEFSGGKLSVIRGGEPFDETHGIHEVGTHAAMNCFCGLDKIMGERYYASHLFPENFQEGDVLVLEIPAFPEFDFVGFLGKQFRGMSALLQAFEEKRQMPLSEVRERMMHNLDSMPDPLEGLQILRLRRK